METSAGLGGSAGASSQPAPGTAEIRRIAAIANPVLRNLEITEAYSRLAAAVAQRSYPCSNWCTFATWASRQAGRTVRGEDLLEELERELGRDAELLHPVATAWRRLVRRGLFQPDTRLGRAMRGLHTPFDAFELASDAVARGNRKVFAEIGLEFARYLEECDAALPPEAPEFRRFLDGLAPGDPPDGQDLLRRAFTRYQQQRTEGDARLRAQLIVLANLEIGLHEQTRLQPEIREALDAPTAPDPTVERLLRGLPRPIAAVLRPICRRTQRELSELSRHVVTRCFMVLTLPGTVLSLARAMEHAPRPDNLRTLSNAELEALLGRYEPVAPALDDYGARDWSDLRQRMHYIVHLFLAFHERQELVSPPFTPEQVERFRSGVIPDGEL
jgi:hypothetical protein